MTKNNKLKNIEISAFIGLLAAIFACFTNCFYKTENISKNVLRLHILANSNSKEDQNLKLKVRDEIIKNFNFNSSENNIEKAKQEIKKNMPKIKQVAEDVIKKEGFCYSVKPNLLNMYFTTKEYDGFSMPAGFYDALRIEIGKAKGKNWWCVLVPSMCIPAANKKEQALETFSPDEKDLIKNGKKTEVRFAFVELFKNLFF